MIVWIGLNALWFGFLAFVHIGFSLTLAFSLNIILIICAHALRNRKDAERTTALPLLTRSDLVVWVLLIACITCLVVFRYGIPPKIMFLSSDAAYHYMASRLLAEGGVATEQFISHLVSAIMISTFGFLVDSTERFIIFISAEVFLLFLSGTMFYSLISTLCPRLRLGWLTVLSLLYTAGFPLTTLFMGFSYLGFSITVICALLFASVLFRDCLFSIQAISLTSLLLYEISISYVLFAPIIFFCVFAFYLVMGIKQHQKWSHLLLLEIALVGVPAFLCAIIVGLPLLHGDQSLSEGIRNEGYTFCNAYAPFIFLAPLSVLGIINRLKNRSFCLFDTMSLSFLLFCVAFFACTLMQLVSIYYFSKVLNAVWLIFFAYTAIGIEASQLNAKRFLVSYAIVWGALLLIALPGLDTKLSRKFPRLAPAPLASELYPIYVYNLDKMDERPIDQDTIDAFTEIHQRVQAGEKIGLVMNDIDGRWYSALFDDNLYIPYWTMEDSELMATLEEYDSVFVGTREHNFKTRSGTPYSELAPQLLDRFNHVIFENESGSLVEIA